MAEIPKIVRERLAQQATAGRPVGVGQQTAAHPDANLLTAFAEQSLSVRERAQVLEHLASCAACRDVVSLALPLESETTRVLQPARAEQPWFRWQTLRWGALAASLTIAAIAVLQTPNLLRSRMAVTRPISSDAERVEQDRKRAAAAPETTASKIAEQPPAETAKEEAPKPRPKLLQGRVSAAGPPPAPQAQMAQAPGGSTQTYARLTDKAKVAEASGAVAGGMLAGKAAAGEKHEVAAEATAPARRDAALAKDRLEAKAAPAPPAATADRAPEAPAKSATLNEMKQQEFARKSEKARSAPAPAAAVRYVPPPARWTISASGTLQASHDGGKTWEDVTLDQRVTFRAVAAVGTSVWAGGAGGALYHSTDGGQHWSRIAVEADGQTLTGDIVRIDFTDTTHGTLSTSTGEKWMTADAGQSWKRQ